MYTQFVNGYDKAIGVFQDTMKENSEFANLVSQFQVGYLTINVFIIPQVHIMSWL